MQIECCVQSFAEAQLAHSLGADRIELCSALSVGGLTPSLGLIRQCCQLPELHVHVLIRPQEGDFYYDGVTLEIMQHDVTAACEAGAQGIVVGALDTGQQIDERIFLPLLQQAKSMGLKVTFHRAFDFCTDPMGNLQKLIDWEVDFLLTSGQAERATEGLPLLKNMLARAQGSSLTLMAGGGVSAQNFGLFKEAGLPAVHFSLGKASRDSHALGMGRRYRPDKDKLAAILKQC